MVILFCLCFITKSFKFYIFLGTLANDAATKVVKETIGQKIEVYLKVNVIVHFDLIDLSLIFNFRRRNFL